MILANKPTNTISAFRVGANYTDENWMTSSKLNEITKAKFFPGSVEWIINAHWSETGASLGWTQFEKGKEIGTTLVTWYLDNADSIPIIGFVRDKALICSHYNSQVGLLFSNTLAMAYINPKSDLKTGANFVEMSISDIQGGTKTTGTIYKLNSLASQIKLSKDHNLGLDFTKKQEISLKTKIESGNFVEAWAETSLESDFELDAFVSKYIEFSIPDGGKLICDGSSCLNFNEKYYWFNTCQQTGGSGTEVSCNHVEKETLSPGEQVLYFGSLNDKAWVAGTYTGLDVNKSKFLVAGMGISTTFFLVDGMIQSVVMQSDPNDQNTGYVYYLIDQQVFIVKLTLMPFNFIVTRTIDLSSVRGEDFCPKQIALFQNLSEGLTFNVLSTCTSGPGSGSYTSSAIY